MLKCSLAFYPKAMVCTHSTERCSRSHYSPFKYVTLLTCNLVLSALMKIAFKGPQPRASNPDSVLSNSGRNTDSTTNCSTLEWVPAGEKSWDSIIGLSHPRMSLLSHAARVCGKTENTTHSRLLLECITVWKGLQTQQSARGASKFTTWPHPETELTRKIINSYIPRNKTEWY